MFLLAALLKLEITVPFLWLSLPVHSGSLKRIKCSKLYSLAHSRLSNVFSALKGTHLYILFDSRNKMEDYMICLWKSRHVSLKRSYLELVISLTFRYQRNKK